MTDQIMQKSILFVLVKDEFPCLVFQSDTGLDVELVEAMLERARKPTKENMPVEFNSSTFMEVPVNLSPIDQKTYGMDFSLFQACFGAFSFASVTSREMVQALDPSDMQVFVFILR